jgi:hypothetical protein
MYLAGIPQMTPELAWIFSISWLPARQKRNSDSYRHLGPARTVVEGLIWPFSLAFGAVCAEN